ncbi:hypothetical protein [Rhodoferax sp.]|uniref:hypothetical protein n=1 Tax=Rhodoferax sp. TaxID=50421 RepID=UPI0025F611F2|nr:hypothetical protein [Rhodoferax sp.]MCM2340859.1 hypothetical protein [Rhodoferax sp.]
MSQTPAASSTTPPNTATHAIQGRYQPLEQVTKPNLTTAELAFYSNMAEQTWRVKACYDTAPAFLRPLRVFGRLAWPTSGAKKLLGVAA